MQRHHDVAAVVFTNLGVLYSVLLGFTVVNVQQQFDQVGNNAEVEASNLSQLYWDSQVFPENHRHQIRQSIQEYAKNVIEDEWKNMSKGIPSRITAESIKSLWEAFYAIEPTTKYEEIWYSNSVSNLNGLMDARLKRLQGSQQSLSPEMWDLLAVGGFAMVAFICIFGIESPWIHLLMGASLAATIAFLLFLIYSLDTAFTGQSSISPTAMKSVFQSFLSS